MENIKKFCVISCPISTRSGYGSRSRDFVRALIKSKPDWDIHILSQRWGMTPMDALKVGDDDDLLSRIITQKLDKKPNIWIQITVPNEFQAVGDYNIGVTAGVETTVMPPECLEGINRMDLTLVSSNFTKEVIQNSIFDKKDQQTGHSLGQLKLEKPVEVLFEGINLDIYDEKAPSEERIDTALKNVKETFAFLFVGHWLKGDFQQDRKNVSGLIWTFLQTFKNKTNSPALILKTSSGGTSLVDRVRIKKMIEQIKEAVKSEVGVSKLPNIYLLHSDLTDFEMNTLYNHPKIKCHISFTRGEGFGRPLLEATISGKPMIVSGWSGHMDFINTEYVTVVDGKLENVHKSAADKFLLEEGQWFTIDYSKAASYMKDIAENHKSI
jgi:glycosyltransferase involved in cell wall biosynthesis